MARGRAILATSAALALLVLSGHAGGAEVRVGDPAPPFTLSAFDGRRVSLAELRGQVICVDLWATWCATCRSALPALDAIARRTPGATFLAVGVDATPAAAERFLTEHLPAPAMTMLHDPGGTVAARWGAAGMPALWVIDRQGVVRLVKTGYEPDAPAEVERVLRALLAAGAP